MGFLALAGIVYLLLVVRPTGRLEWWDIVTCLMVAISAGVAVPGPRGEFKTEFYVFLLVFCVLMVCVALIRLVKLAAGMVFAWLALAVLALIALCPPTKYANGEHNW